MRSSNAQQVLNSVSAHVATEAQHGLYYLCRLNPDSPAYNVSCCYQLTGKIDLVALNKSLASIVKRHDALRTHFCVSSEGLLALTCDSNSETTTNANAAAASNAKYDYLRIESLPDDIDTSVESELLNRIINEPFNLDNGSALYRCVLLSSADGENHRLVFVVHHLVFDHFSKSVFQFELTRFYAAHTGFASQDEYPAPNVEYQLNQYANYKHQQCEAKNYKRQLAYWEKKLLNHSQAYIPIDYTRPTNACAQGIRIRRRISASQIESMRTLASANQTTLFMGMLTIGQLLISRWSGEPCVSVGTHMQDRRELGSEHAIGFFLNTLVLVSNFDDCDDFIDALKVVRKTCFDAFRFSQVSFERLVQSLPSIRESSRTPFFDIRFSHLSPHEHDLDLNGVQVQAIEPNICRARYDLTFTFHENTDQCFIEAEYKTSLFNENTINWLLDNYLEILQGVSQNSNYSISDMGLIRGEKQEQLLKICKPEPVEFPEYLTIAELVSRQVIESPDKPAVYDDAHHLTYRTLDSDSTKLAKQLLHSGVSSGSIVGVCMERSTQMMVALLAVLKVGAAYLPLDKNFPKERLLYMLSDSGCRTLLVDESTSGTITLNEVTELHVHSLVNSPLNDAEANAIEKPVIADVKPSDIAYLIYTSGSTGNPKAVQVTHQNVVNFLASMGKTPGLNQNDVIVAVTTLSFDIAVLELWLPLVVGASVVIASKETSTNGKRLASLLRESNATMMQATPVTWRLLLSAGWKGCKKFTALCGGEALPPDLGKTLSQQCKALWNMYGPTETTVWSCLWKVDSDAPQMLIGKPIDNTSVYVLDRFGQLSYPGTVGHLHIGGAGVSAGYLGNKELTQQKFFANPLDANETLYATGDSVKQLSDGNLTYIGRIDNQIKLRGHRIELGEIEAKLTAHPKVQEAAATIVEYDNGDVQLHAYVTGFTDDSNYANELRTHLKSLLPRYMVPQHFLLMDFLPQTPNGKIDRKALPTDLPKPIASLCSSAEPKTRLEKQLAGIWADVLQIDNVPVSETFFDLGGHSLLAMLVLAKAKSEMALEIDPVAMIDSPIKTILAGKDPEVNHHQKHQHQGVANAQKPTVKTGFFDSNRLYARLHVPHHSIHVQGSVLLCNPLFAEANHVHWAYRQLANRLAADGYMVLRFDYFGCGNSLGEDEDGSVDEWLRNIKSASAYLCEASGHTLISMVGYRFGAALASMTESFDVDQLILWEPVFHGADQVRHLDSKYSAAVKGLNGFRPNPTTKQSSEITGFTFTRTLRDELTQFQFAYTGSAANSRQIKVVSQHQAVQNDSSIHLLESEHNDVAFIHVDDSAPSIDALDEQAAWLPGKSLTQVVSLISGKRDA